MRLIMHSVMTMTCHSLTGGHCRQTMEIDVKGRRAGRLRAVARTYKDNILHRRPGLLLRLEYVCLRQRLIRLAHAGRASEAIGCGIDTSSVKARQVSRSWGSQLSLPYFGLLLHASLFSPAAHVPAAPVVWGGLGQGLGQD